MKFFIMRRKQLLEQNLNNDDKKNNKKIEYKASSKLDDEKVDINIALNTKLEKDKNKNKKDETQEILEKIEMLEGKIMEATNNEVYKTLDKLSFSAVTSPIKKTNVILKNVNFQYAVKLWDYLQDNFEDKTKSITEKKDYMDQGELKNLTDETFLLNYLILSKIDKKDEAETEVERKHINDNLVDLLVKKMVNIDDSITEEQIKNMVGQKFAVIKYKNMATIQEIQKIFKKHIDEYLEKIK